MTSLGAFSEKGGLRTVTTGGTVTAPLPAPADDDADRFLPGTQKQQQQQQQRAHNHTHSTIPELNNSKLGVPR
jgi:hypothetical protein